MDHRSQFFKRSDVLPSVEIRKAKQSTACYDTHSHDEFSFGVIDQGIATYRYLKETYITRAGDTVLINPNDAHACNPRAGQWSYRMLFVDTVWVKDVQQEMSELSVGYYLPFQIRLCRDKAFYARFNRLYMSLLGDNPLEAETLLIEYLSHLFSSDHSGIVVQDQPALERVETLINDRLADNLTLSDFAAQSGLSRYHLVRSFKQKYGLSPHAYQLDTRIRRAKKMLQQGDSLVEVAGRLGFADQSHFQRHFKKRLAVTPKQYQSFFIN